MKKPLENIHILMGVTGSIAAFKACEVLRLLQKEGADVKVVMTKAAQKFVTPLTFETLSRNDVVRDLFPEHRPVKTRHISLAEWAHCILICPATANVIGKIAAGIADDFLTTVVMASRTPVLFAPAMDYQMVQNPVYLANCDQLRKYGYRFIETQEGELASGAKGPGRLAESYRILQGVKKSIFGRDIWKSKKVLVTAGPTQEPLDPIRYLTNPSSGKMGFAIADEACLRGADVTLITGPASLQPPDGIKILSVRTAEEMAGAVHHEWVSNEILIMAAAVADFKPAHFSSTKIKKDKSDKITLPLIKTEDILASIARGKKHGLVVGFALETDDGEQNAIKKLKEKKLDLICLNNPLEENAGFEKETNRITLIGRNHDKKALPVMPKWEAAQNILDYIESML